MYFYYVAFHDTCIIHREHKIVNSKIFAAHKINKLAFAIAKWYNIFFRNTMISGIYKLTFRSGRIYIGKSENIEQRWEQHRASFVKGTHSKKMQAEYAAYGPPTYEVILYAHADHIDIYESIIIKRFWGSMCLNSTKPRPISHEEAQKYLGYYDDLKYHDRSIMLYSTLVHLEVIDQFNETISELKREVELWKSDVHELEMRGIKMPKTWDKIREQVLSENTSMRNQLRKLKKLGWWDRLFNYRVNV